MMMPIFQEDAVAVPLVSRITLTVVFGYLIRRTRKLHVQENHPQGLSQSAMLTSAG